MGYCIKCGYKMEERDRFCSKCGATIFYIKNKDNIIKENIEKEYISYESLLNNSNNLDLNSSENDNNIFPDNPSEDIRSGFGYIFDGNKRKYFLSDNEDEQNELEQGNNCVGVEKDDNVLGTNERDPDDERKRTIKKLKIVLSGIYKMEAIEEELEIKQKELAETQNDYDNVVSFKNSIKLEFALDSIKTKINELYEKEAKIMDKYDVWYVKERFRNSRDVEGILIQLKKKKAYTLEEASEKYLAEYIQEIREKRRIEKEERKAERAIRAQEEKERKERERREYEEMHGALSSKEQKKYNKYLRELEEAREERIRQDIGWGIASAIPGVSTLNKVRKAVNKISDYSSSVDANSSSDYIYKRARNDFKKEHNIKADSEYSIKNVAKSVAKEAILNAAGKDIKGLYKKYEKYKDYDL